MMATKIVKGVEHTEKPLCTTCGKECVPFTRSGACKACFKQWLNATTPHPGHNAIYRTRDQMEDERETCWGMTNPSVENAVRELEECT